VFYGLFQQHEQMDRVATSMIVKGLVSLLVVMMAVLITGSIVAAAIGLASVWALLLVSYDAPGGTTLLEAYDNTGQHTTLSTPPFINIVQPRWHAPTLMKLTKRTLPLGLAGFLVSLNPNIPRYFVERLFGERELGIFAAMAYILVVGNTVVSALAQAANPRLATYYAAGHMTLFRTLLFKLVGVGVTLGCIGTIVSWFAGREILVLVYGIEYGAYASVFVWLMVAAGIGYVASFLTYAMLAARVVLMQLSLFVVVTCITLVCCLYLLPVYGLLGGAWALMIGFSTQAGGAFVILQRAEHTIPSS
jgi:O-antigen/teichoic acid export membrane protein